jgi:hypothetical protein
MIIMHHMLLACSILVGIPCVNPGARAVACHKVGAAVAFAWLLAIVLAARACGGIRGDASRKLKEATPVEPRAHPRTVLVDALALQVADLYTISAQSGVAHAVEAPEADA